MQARSRKYLQLAVFVISLLTFMAGFLQVVRPTLVLSLIRGEGSELAILFFSIVGMFMSLFGGLVCHGLYTAQPNSVIITWCALQKAGASLAVLIGILKGLVSPVAGLVSAFDFLSAVILFIYLSGARSTENENNLFAGTSQRK